MFPTKTLCRASVALALVHLVVPALVAATAYAKEAAPPEITPVLVDVITVRGERVLSNGADRIQPSAAPVIGPDATGLVARLPGAAQVNNGALSGQVQYRGLFGHRVGVTVNNQNFASGGPNMMDPPLAYAPLPLVDRITVARGIGGVSAGPGLGGQVDVTLKSMPFASGSGGRFGYDFMAEGRTVDESYALGGMAGYADDRLRFHVLGAREEGENRDFPGGTVANTFYERDTYGAGMGFRAGDHELSAEYRRAEVGPSGNPPFAMDIGYVRTDFVTLGYAGKLGDLGLTAAFGYADVAHLMDNFTLRPNPGVPMRARQNLTDAETITGEVGLVIPAAAGELRVGADLSRTDHNAQISNPNMPAFFVDQFAGAEVDRTGAYVEWHGALGAVEADVGLRYDRYRSRAGEVTVGPALPMGPRMLQMAFNGGDRSQGDDALDVVARLWWASDARTTWRATLARKTRVASYLERFAWLPTEASGGLADGNIYVGDLTLDPEVAWIAEAGVDWKGDRFFARPTVFYRRVNDFIQGVPVDATPGVIDSPIEMVAAMNGDPTPLRFANVDAELYGFDMDFGVRINAAWRLDGVASWVRGKRRDIDDDLYRIAPPNMTLAATYEQERWSVTAEGRFVADQNKVSLTNDEATTGGYAVFGISGRWRLRDGIELMGGVENLFDKRFEEHLAGYNRVMNSDVPVGARLPGAGIGGFLRISIRG